MSLLKQDFLHIDLTPFLESVISEIQNLPGHVFFQNVQDLIYISKMQQKIEKKFYVFEIIASQFVSLNFLY